MRAQQAVGLLPPQLPQRVVAQLLRVASLRPRHVVEHPHHVGASEPPRHVAQQHQPRRRLAPEEEEERQLAAPPLEHLEHELRVVGTVHQPNG